MSRERKQQPSLAARFKQARESLTPFVKQEFVLVKGKETNMVMFPGGDIGLMGKDGLIFQVSQTRQDTEEQLDRVLGYFMLTRYSRFDKVKQDQLLVKKRETLVGRVIKALEEARLRLDLPKEIKFHNPLGY